MEATSLGVWFANRSEAELEDAIDILATAPIFRDPGWITTAMQVRAKYPLKGDESDPVSIGICTWFYGHEYTSLLNTHLAKFFANSLREDALLTIAFSGIIYFEGAAGTMSEVFADGCQNYYETFGVSPMIFYGSDFWKSTVDLLKNMSKGRAMEQWVSIADSPEEAVSTILRFEKLRNQGEGNTAFPPKYPSVNVKPHLS